MKSIKEKAKAYDEALEKAKKYYEDCKQRGNLWFIEDMEDMFPELKESEEDRIKKKIIATIHLYYGEPLEEEAKEMIAWVEKQGELSICNTPSREVILSIWNLGNEWKELTNGCISTEYGTQLDYIQKHWQESEYYLKEKQDEQKPANWFQELEDKLANATPQQLAEWKEKYFKEEPAEWSEEDENIIEWLIGYLEYQIINATITEEKDNCLDAISMLKSLKDRVQPQPKQEWSEEDEKHLNRAINILDSSKTYTTSPDKYEGTINWLKSLKDRYAWKPSDAQMVALKCAITTADEKWVCMNTKDLESLYEDIKKLKA